MGEMEYYDFGENIKREFELLDVLRAELKRRSERLLKIIEFFDYTLKSEYPDDYENISPKIEFWNSDIKEILKQKNIEDYKMELYDIVFKLKYYMKQLGFNKIRFYRRYKIWLINN